MADSPRTLVLPALHLMSAQITPDTSLPTAPPAQESPLSRRRWAVLALLTVLVAGTWVDLAALLTYPVAVGVDGYYYVLQVNALRGQGGLYFPTAAPLVLYLLSGVSYLAGDPVVAIKIVSVLLHAALCVGIFAIITSSTRAAWLGVLGSALAAAFGTHRYMVAEFINNLGALTFLVWSGWCAVRAYQTRQSLRASLSVALLVAAFFSHRSAPAVAAAVAVSVLLMYLWAGSEVDDRNRRLVAVFAVILLWLLPALLASQRLLPLPAWMEGELMNRPRLPLSQMALAEKLILIVVAPTVLLLISWEPKRRARLFNVVFGSVAVWALLITLNPFLDHARVGMGTTWRLNSLAYIQAAILVPGLVWLILPMRREYIFYLAAVILPLAVWSARDLPPYGMRREYLLRREQLLQGLSSCRGRLGPSPLVLSPHGDQFIVTSTLGVPAQQRWPADSTDRTIYWLLDSVEPRFLTPSAIILVTGRGGNLTVLAKDDDVRRSLDVMGASERRQLLINNPHLHDYFFNRPQ